jgi:hypothetical protein
MLRTTEISNPMKLQLGLKMVVLIGGRVGTVGTVGTVGKVTGSVGRVGNTVDGKISVQCIPKSLRVKFK